MKPLSAAIALALAAGLDATAAADVGPSTAEPAYLTPSVPTGVEITSLLTVGDTVKKKYKGDETYRMVGIPDGLGAYDNGDGTITVLMNHELGAAAGIARAHGGKGAFVSRWQIRKSDLAVLNGVDLIDRVYLWDAANRAYVQTKNVAFNRFCSADLPPRTAFYNAGSDLGFSDGYIYLNGEEAGSTGRAFAHVIQGRGNSATWELYKLGRFSWENAVASPHPQDKTIVAGLDDGSLGTSKVYFYVGTKQSEGSPIEQAGLTNGTSYRVVVSGFGTEPVSVAEGTSWGFSLATSGGAGLNRVEDGAWDPVHPNVFYFVTTASFATSSRLWQLTFDDIENPTAGGTIKVLVDGASRGSNGPKMMDNLTVDASGNLIIQEDPGNQPYRAKVWSYDPTNDALVEIARFDAERFTPPAASYPGFITQDEESSGVIEITSLLDGVDGYDTAANRYFLLDAQVHKDISVTEPELVEMGQLLLMKVAK